MNVICHQASKVQGHVTCAPPITVNFAYNVTVCRVLVTGFPKSNHTSNIAHDHCTQPNVSS